MTLNLSRAIQFHIVLLPILDEWEGWTVSTFRCIERNVDVGGHPESHHMDGTAADCYFYHVSQRNGAWFDCYEMGLHGLKKQYYDAVTKQTVYGFHMQLDPKKEEPGG